MQCVKSGRQGGPGWLPGAAQSLCARTHRLTRSSTIDQWGICDCARCWARSRKACTGGASGPTVSEVHRRDPESPTSPLFQRTQNAPRAQGAAGAEVSLRAWPRQARPRSVARRRPARSSVSRGFDPPQPRAVPDWTCFSGRAAQPQSHSWPGADLPLTPDCNLIIIDRPEERAEREQGRGRGGQCGGRDLQSKASRQPPPAPKVLAGPRAGLGVVGGCRQEGAQLKGGRWGNGGFIN